MKLQLLVGLSFKANIGDWRECSAITIVKKIKDN